MLIENLLITIITHCPNLLLFHFLRANVQITNLSAELAGLYTCVAVSERGVEATGTLVCVAERPPAPAAPRVAGQSGSSVKLEWSPSPEPVLPTLPYPLPGTPLELFRRALQTLFYCIEFSTNGTMEQFIANGVLYSTLHYSASVQVVNIC